MFKLILFGLSILPVLMPLILTNVYAVDEIQVKGGEAVASYLGDGSSMIDWQKIESNIENDAADLFDLNLWKENERRSISDYQWKFKIQKSKYREKIGMILGCIGVCHHYRGTGYSKAGFRSPIIEGDELETLEDSYAWVILLEGTLVRLAPKSAITFLEINIGREKNFLNARVDKGLVYWRSRDSAPIEDSSSPETDAIFLPLEWYPANLIQEKTVIKDDKLDSLLDEEVLHQNHIKRVNKLIVKNNEIFQRPTHTLLIMPNGNIYGEYLQVLAFVNFQGSSFFKAYSAGLDLRFRGYKNFEKLTIRELVWYKVSVDGKQAEEFEAGSKVFGLSELLLKRIPSVMMAREMFLLQHARALFDPKISKKQLAEEHGYRLWESEESDKSDKGDNKKASTDLDLRIAFLHEYSRRVETTNLVSTGNLGKRILELSEGVAKDGGGMFPPKVIGVHDTGYDHEYHRSALKSYLDYILTLNFASKNKSSKTWLWWPILKQKYLHLGDDFYQEFK